MSIDASRDAGVTLLLFDRWRATDLCLLLQVVKVLNLEEGGAFTVSSADTIMEALG